jgi:hypothetical protein
MVLGCMLSSYQRPAAVAQTPADTAEADADVMAQLKEMNLHLKRIDNVLNTGTIKTLTVMR